MTGTIRTGVLELAFERWGPADSPGGTPVVLVHGFPDGAQGWADVARPLADKGRRVVAPYLRGFAPTRFLDATTVRSGQVGALTRDLLDLLDGLGLDRAVLVGQDWGARAVQGVAAVAPERVERLVSLGGYALSWDQGGPPSYRQLQALWYQFLLRTDWAEAILRFDAIGFSRHLWRIWSPTWDGAETAFSTVIPNLEGPDLAPVVLSAYRDDPADDRYAELESRLTAGPPIEVPTVLLHGADDGLEPDGPDTEGDARHFTSLLGARTVPGAGHFLHRERPDAVLDALS
jgi:pimeloyl-ACP methyl ester carboxylesterase